MNNLPELPLEKILGYLSLEERIKAMAVSRSWRKMIGSFRPTSLFFSDRPSGFIYGKVRLIDGAFARNFISSSRFEKFFNAFGQSIFSNLKHLRLCDLELNAGNRRVFIRTLNSFGQLEELGLFRLKPQGDSKLKTRLNLNLPMLNSIHLEDDLTAINPLTVDAPKLKNVKLWDSPHLGLDIIHGETVEKLIVFEVADIKVEKMKNLKYLYASGLIISSTLLSGLEQLKEIHLQDRHDAKELFKQKQRYGRAELKIFLDGLALNGPDDPAVHHLSCIFGKNAIRCLAENASSLANEIPFCTLVYYNSIEAVIGSEIDLLNRLTDLKRIDVSLKVQNIERFLKNLDSISALFFGLTSQSQTLFDRLPHHCAVQWLRIRCMPDDLKFLARLKNLIHLELVCPIDTQTIRQVLGELPFLCHFEFQYPYFGMSATATVKIDHHPRRRFQISSREKSTTVFDVDAAIQFIVNLSQAKKRKTKGTESFDQVGKISVRSSR